MVKTLKNKHTQPYQNNHKLSQILCKTKLEDSPFINKILQLDLSKEPSKSAKESEFM